MSSSSVSRTCQACKIGEVCEVCEVCEMCEVCTKLRMALASRCSYLRTTRFNNSIDEFMVVLFTQTNSGD